MRRWLVFLILLLTLAVLLTGCGGNENATTDQNNGGTSSEGPVGQAEATACAANRRAISSAAQQYFAVEGAYPSSIQQLVPDYLTSVPTCPSGGTYTLQGKTVTCSVHGS
jgi:hypothetical protein